MDWEKLVHFYLFQLSSKISSFSKPFLAFPSALMPGVLLFENDSLMRIKEEVVCELVRPFFNFVQHAQVLPG